jgi:mannose/fructose/N-acetylgalactosamine-specific phosphotransferase system component IID
MKFTDEPHVVNRDVSDDWGCTFTKGFEILEGFYYDRMNNSPYKYKLIKFYNRSYFSKDESIWYIEQHVEVNFVNII